MELYFASREFNGSSSMALDAEESRHCIKVMRHKEGDIINIIDGSGSLFKCRILSTGKKDVVCSIEEEIPAFGAHPYHLTMAVAPTKNMERYEWFLEKATETGLNTIVPVICNRSERREVNTERCSRILKSAVKQSLKGALPQMHDCISLTQWIETNFTHSNGICTPRQKQDETYLQRQKADLRLICYCGDEYPKQEITASLAEFFNRYNNSAATRTASTSSTNSDNSPAPAIFIIIGPEGDFSPQEVKCAMEHGFKAVTLGPSRLRVESAALMSVNAVYLATI